MLFAVFQVLPYLGSRVQNQRGDNRPEVNIIPDEYQIGQRL